MKLAKRQTKTSVISERSLTPGVRFRLRVHDHAFGFEWPRPVDFTAGKLKVFYLSLASLKTTPGQQAIGAINHK